jgi:alpha-glucosidase
VNGTFAKRILSYSPDQKTFTISKSEGSYSSLFRKLKLCFHGFVGIDAVKIGDTSAKVETKEYRFVQPISNYDPVGTMPEGLKINSLKFLVTNYTSDQLEISW